MQTICRVVGWFCIMVAGLMLVIGQTSTCISLACLGGINILLASKLSDKAKEAVAGNQAEPPQKENTEYYDPPIPPGFMSYLRETGQDDPRYSGRYNALECVLIDLPDDKERAVFWAYAVDCALHDQIMGNILQAPDYFKYRSFAEYASRHGDVLQSIAARRSRDYWNPTTTTKAYKAAVEFLKR